MVLITAAICVLLAFVGFSQSQDTWGCTTKAKLGFILDASSSVGRLDFQKQSDFVKNIAEYFNIRPGGSQAGVVTMHDRAQVDIRFGDRPDVEVFKRAMDFVPYTGGQRRIDLGLKKAATELFRATNGDREGIAKIAVLVTYGKQTPASDVTSLTEAVKQLQRLGVKVIAIGVGTRADRNELSLIVEKDENLISVQSYNDLLRQVGVISRKTCNALKSKKLKCTERLHVGFLVDTSGSIGPEDFRKELDFVKEIVDTLHVGTGQSQGALLSYSSLAQMDIRFGEHSSAIEFKRAVDRVRISNGRTRIDLALRLAATEMFSPNVVRPGLPKVAVVLTDGRQTPDPGAVPLTQAIRPLRKLGVKVLVVGIGMEVNRDELKLLVERDEDLYMAANFDDLLQRAREIAKKTCDVVKPGSVCPNKADLGFIMDVSGSIGDENYRTQREFVKNVTKAFNISPQHTQAGVITYGDNAYVSIRLGDRRTVEEFNEAVDRLPYTGGQTRIDLALNLAATDFFTIEGGARYVIPKIAVVLTDGRQTPAPDAIPAQQAVIPLRKLGVKMFAVGIGLEADPIELGYIVERPEDVVMIDDFDKLADFAKDISKKICEGANIGPISSGRPTCEEKADVAFVMDTSRFVNKSSLEMERDFVKALAESFYIEPGESRAALITYNNTAHAHVRMGEHTPVERFQQAVDSVVHTGGGMRLDRALRQVISVMFTPGNERQTVVPKLAVVLAGGPQTLESDSEPLERVVLSLRRMGVHVITVGVGKQVDGPELRLTVERDVDLFFSDNFDQLLTKVDEILNRMCQNVKAAAEMTKCQKTVDVAFALDSSRSMRSHHFETQKNFVKLVAQQLRMGPGKSRVGAIVFSDQARSEIPLSQFRSFEEFKHLVEALSFRGGRTRIDKALHAAVSLFQAANFGRSNVPRFFVLLTDGAQTITPDMVSLNVAVTPLRRAGVKVIAVGIGNSVSYSELLTLSDTNQDVFLVQSFDQLMTAVELIKEKICEN